MYITLPLLQLSKMATPSVVPASNLKCSICLDLFSDPRVLPCLHIYCLKCLQGLVSKEKSYLSCPQCRAKHEIPKGDVANYLCDLSILPELEAAKATSRKEEAKMCGLCTSGEVAVGYCQDCGEYLCNYCQDMHKKVKTFATHKIASMEALSTITYATKQSASCPYHSKYELEIFCKTCDTLVCSMCMLESTHKGHNYDFLKNVHHKLTKRIKSMTQSIKKKGKEFKSCLVSVEKFEQRVCSQRDKLEAEIIAVYDEYITKIQAMKEELLKQVESKFTEDSKTIWATKDHLEVLLSQVESCQTFSERYQKQGSEGQTLSLLNQLLHHLTELDSAVADTSIIFSSTTPLTDLKKSVLNLSSLGTLSVAKDATFTQGSLQDTSTVFIYKKTTLVYVLNEPLAHLIKWECKYGHNDNLTATCPVVVANDNQLEIEFTPMISGTYSFQLIPTGCPIVGIQKFAVTVYEYIFEDMLENTIDLVVEHMEEVTKEDIQQTTSSYGLTFTNNSALTMSSYGKNMKPPEKPKRSSVVDKEEIPPWKKRLEERRKQRENEMKEKEVKTKDKKPPEQLETSDVMDQEEEKPAWKKRLEERRKKRENEVKEKEVKTKDKKPPEQLETSDVMDQEEEKPAWKKQIDERRKQRENEERERSYKERYKVIRKT